VDRLDRFARLEEHRLRRHSSRAKLGKQRLPFQRGQCLKEKVPGRCVRQAHHVQLEGYGQERAASRWRSCPESVGGGGEGPELIDSGNPKLVLPLDKLGDDVEVAIHHGVDGRDELLRVGKHEHGQGNQDGGDALEDLGGRELDLRCLLEAFCDCSIGGAGVVGVVGQDCFLVTSRSRLGVLQERLC